jgi:hypothetical protein
MGTKLYIWPFAYGQIYVSHWFQLRIQITWRNVNSNCSSTNRFITETVLMFQVMLSCISYCTKHVPFTRKVANWNAKWDHFFMIFPSCGFEQLCIWLSFCRQLVWISVRVPLIPSYLIRRGEWWNKYLEVSCGCSLHHPYQFTVQNLISSHSVRN